MGDRIPISPRGRAQRRNNTHGFRSPPGVLASALRTLSSSTTHGDRVGEAQRGKAAGPRSHSRQETLGWLGPPLSRLPGVQPSTAMSPQTFWPATAISGSTHAPWLQSLSFLRDGQGLAGRRYALPTPTPVHEPPLVSLPQVCRSPASLPEFPALKNPVLAPLLQCRLRMVLRCAARAI